MLRLFVVMLLSVLVYAEYGDDYWKAFSVALVIIVLGFVSITNAFAKKN